MTNEEAILCLKGMKNFGRDTFTEQTDWQESLDMAISALEQEPIVDRDCEHCSRTYGTFGCCTTVNNEWVYSCKDGQREYHLNKIRERVELEKLGYPPSAGYYKAIMKVLKIIDKYKAEMRGTE